MTGKRRPEPDDDAPLTPLTPLRPRRESVKIPVWSITKPLPPEACRWEGPGGRWVSLTIAHESAMGKVLVCSSEGRVEAVDSYEAALTKAREWRLG